MLGRSYNANSYRYAYNGMLKDDEVYNGSGNSYTTYFRQHDTRLGRWFSVDPEFQPWQSPYTSMDNNPIMFTDPLGNSAVGSLLSSIGAYFKKNYTTTTAFANTRGIAFTVTKVNWTNVLGSTLSVVFNSRTFGQTGGGDKKYIDLTQSKKAYNLEDQTKNILKSLNKGDKIEPQQLGGNCLN